MGFRFRLAWFFVAALVAVQGLTAILVYQVARHELIGEGQRQLDVAADAFVRQLDDISRRVADSVNVAIKITLVVTAIMMTLQALGEMWKLIKPRRRSAA